MWNTNSAECSGGMHDIRSRNVVRRSEEPPMVDKSEPNIVVTDAPEATDTAVIADGLRGYNTSRAGYDDYRPLAVFVTDPATGKVLGGLYGGSYLGQLRVDRFFLPEGLRRWRIGSRVLAMAEAGGGGAAARLRARYAEHNGDPGAGVLSQAGL